MTMNFIKKGLSKAAFIGLTISFAPITVFANGDTCGDPGTICNPIPNVTSIPGLIQTVLISLIKIGIPVIALAIIYCGFLFVAARGNPEKISKAKDALLYTLIGAAVLLGSWALATLISSTILGL